MSRQLNWEVPMNECTASISIRENKSTTTYEVTLMGGPYRIRSFTDRKEVYAFQEAVNYCMEHDAVVTRMVTLPGNWNVRHSDIIHRIKKAFAPSDWKDVAAIFGLDDEIE
jgi:hypothetical protein